MEKINDDGIEQTQRHVMRYPQFFAAKAVRRMLDEGRTATTRKAGLPR